MIQTYGIFVLAAFAEVAGCFAFWAYVRLDKSPFWLIPGVVCLVLFAYLLTRADTELAGRAYAAYGGIYIASSMAWLWIVEGTRPDRWDVIGMTICLVGSLVILLPARA